VSPAHLHCTQLLLFVSDWLADWLQHRRRPPKGGLLAPQAAAGGAQAEPKRKGERNFPLAEAARARQIAAALAGCRPAQFGALERPLSSGRRR